MPTCELRVLDCSAACELVGPDNGPDTLLACFPFPEARVVAVLLLTGSLLGPAWLLGGGGKVAKGLVLLLACVVLACVVVGSCGVGIVPGWLVG